MMRISCRSKIHRATVTECNVNYEGSITIDSTLMKAAGLLPFEQVHVLNVKEGGRFVTYVIEGPPDSGVICINGAAAHLANPGDLVIIIAYGLYSEEEILKMEPVFVKVDAKNKIKK